MIVFCEQLGGFLTVTKAAGEANYVVAGSEDMTRDVATRGL